MIQSNIHVYSTIMYNNLYKFLIHLKIKIKIELLNDILLPLT
jgi:hypothetical protein